MAIARQRLDWEQLKAFWAVAESGSFAAAARTMGVVPSTLTRGVEELERRLGVQLLHRRPGGVALTGDGAEILDATRTMANSAARIERLGDSDSQGGVVQMAAPDGISAYVIAPAMAEFQAAHPRVALVLDCGFWPSDPLGVERDVAVQYDEVTDPDVVATPLAHIHYCLFASRSYVELYGAPPSLAEAAGHRYLHHIAQTRQKGGWAPQFESFQGLANVTLQTNSSSAVLEAARNGAGIAALPSGVVRLAPELVMLGQRPVASVRLWMGYRRERAKGRVRLVIDWLKSLFEAREHGWYRPEFLHPDEFRDRSRAA